jgi:hypothetical protein
VPSSRRRVAPSMGLAPGLLGSTAAGQAGEPVEVRPRDADVSELALG